MPISKHKVGPELKIYEARVDPREVISKRTLEVLDKTMANLQQGHAGEPIDLTSFEDIDNNDLTSKPIPTQS